MISVVLLWLIILDIIDILKLWDLINIAFEKVLINIISIFSFSLTIIMNLLGVWAKRASSTKLDYVFSSLPFNKLTWLVI